MGARDDDEPSDREADAPTPWHHSTAKVLGASVAGLAAVALIVAGVMFLSRDDGDLPEAPPDFVDPTFSSMTSRSTSSSSSTSTTTTRISPPLTTDLDLPPELAPPPPPPTSETSTPRGRSTTQQEQTETNSEEQTPRTTTRSRPRLNETRTLYPRP